MSHTTARESPPIRLRRLGKAGQLAGLTPLAHRPLSPRDRQAWRARRETEMKAWTAAGKTNPLSQGTQANPSLNRVSQTEPAQARKRESAWFAILTTAVLGAIGSLLNESPQAIRLWLDFIRALSGF
jgi:ferric-dicitrate binding protein FerR (iron transport regulator)